MSHLREFAYVEATSVEEALDALNSSPDARLIAGGTVVIPTMKLRLISPETLVSIARVPDLAAVAETEGGVTIGSMATHVSVSSSPTVKDAAPALARACGLVASPVIRSMGTIGGNICYGETASDPSPVLLALGATLHVIGISGRRQIAAKDFFIGFYETALSEGEILTAVEIPRMTEGTDWSYMKWSPRAHEDKPLVGLAITLRSDQGTIVEARMAVGGVAPTPTLLDRASAALVGRRLDDDAVEAAAEAAAEEVEPIEDHQASAKYRQDMLRLWVRRNLVALRKEAA